jgi:hypothetical protein
MRQGRLQNTFFLILRSLWASICGPGGTPKVGIRFTFFMNFLRSVRGGSGALFSLKNNVFCGCDFRKRAFCLRGGPKGPQKYTKQTPKMTPKMTHVGVESAATPRRHNTHTDNTERTHKENAPTKNKENPKNAHVENTHTHTHTHTAPKE